jgi:pimeloyl-ACP methyl ester carboxylesterase
MWIARHPLNNSLAVLIHGLVGDHYATWASAVTIVQNIHDGGDRDLRNYDYFSFHYKSGILNQPAISQYLPELRKLVSEKSYDTVILIGHSQGGILAKLFVIEELIEGRGLNLRVDAVITLDTPHRGPQPWIYPAVLVGGLWKRLPLLNRFALWGQLGELGYGSAILKKVRQEWSRRISPVPCAPTAGGRYIQSATIPGALFGGLVPLIVPEWSSRGIRNVDVFDTTISKRDRTVWTQHGHNVDAMKPFQSRIEAVLKGNHSAAVKAIEDQMSSLSDTEVQNHAINTLFALETQFSEEPPNDTPQYFSQAFQRGFPHRPLRNCTFEKALWEFIRRQLKESGWAERP